MGLDRAKRLVLGLATLYAALKLYKQWQKKRCRPRRLRLREPVKVSHVGQNIRDGYSKKKVPEDIDCIVIGSGIGGLTCAGLLSRAGQRCLVLEQHYIAGGCTHAFEDQGFEFDTGYHYVGNIAKRKKILDLISDSPVEFDQLGSEKDGFCYDVITVGDGDVREYPLRAGKEQWVKDLKAAFPEEHAAIDQWLALVEEAALCDLYFELKIVRPAWLARVLQKALCGKLHKWLGKTALEVCESVTPNKELQAVLLGQFGNYCSRPSKAPFYYCASVVHHYFAGGWYPRGGTSQLARKIVPVIERTGGRVLVRKGVKRIIVENGRAVGVEMEASGSAKGDIIRAKNVIAACGAFATYSRLLPTEHVPKHVPAKLEGAGLSPTLIYVFVGMRGSQKELQLPSHNKWVWPDPDVERMMDHWEGDASGRTTGQKPVPMFLGFPSAKDSTFDQRFPGKSTCCIMMLGDHEWFAEYAAGGTKREHGYEELKAQYRDRGLEHGLFRFFPQLRDRVEYTAVGTSLTFNHYIASERGEVYGLGCGPSRYAKDDWLRPETEIPNLYMAGQDVCSLGITGALMGGVLTAHTVLGYGTISDVWTGRNLVEDIMHLDEA